MPSFGLKTAECSLFCLPVYATPWIYFPSTAQRRTRYPTDGLGCVGFDKRTVQEDAGRGEAGARDGIHIHVQLVLGSFRPRRLGVRHLSPLGVAVGGDGAGGDGAIGVSKRGCPF